MVLEKVPIYLTEGWLLAYWLLLSLFARAGLLFVTECYCRCGGSWDVICCSCYLVLDDVYYSVVG